MASGVFGIPVTEKTVAATGEYKDPITQKDVAEYALKMMNSYGKDIQAQQFVDNLKERYGNGSSTKCLIYNATGTTMNLVTYKDWHGHIYDTPYPAEIQNGQWGAFLHVHPTARMEGSAGAIVYRSKIPSGGDDSCDWLFAWSVPFIGDNTVYTEIREQDHFPEHWNYIYHSKLENSSRTCTDHGYGYLSKTDIGEGTTVDSRAVFEFPN